MPDVIYFLEDFERKHRRKDAQIEGKQRNIRSSLAMDRMRKQHPATTWTSTEDGTKKYRVSSWDVQRKEEDFVITSHHEVEEGGDIKKVTKIHTLSPNRYGPCVGEG